ncbi:MAG: hypothetical protein V7L20_02730 [Nostoc sp.]|uniref:hypothetical protein n=1 Tax=Nostoc sp. TaxID=1180 RepID=UPI002FF55533
MQHNSCSLNFSSDRPSIVTSKGDRSFFSLPWRPLRLCGSILMPPHIQSTVKNRAIA